MTSRSLSRILTGLLVFPLACSSGGSSGTGTGGSNGTGTGGTTSTGTGGTSSTGSGGTSATGTGGTSATGTGGSNTTGGTGGRATGTGGTVVTGAGGSAGNRGSGGSAGSRASGGSTGGGGTATTGSGGSGTGAGGSTADQNVLERNKNPSRDGLFIQPTLTKTMAMAMAADTTFNTNATLTSSTSANVAASPTYLDGPNGTGMFFIPTVGGDVIARKEDGTSAWSTSIGAPATGGIGCSSFATTAPLGILSTPAIDAQSKTIYVAGILGTAQGVTSQVASAIDIATGKVKSGWPVDVGTLASFDPKIHNQRSALSLVNGTLFVSYAGYVGDCGSYHGRVVAINTATQAMAGQWATGDMGGGIWASGGLASDGTNVFAATGNYVPLSSAPATHTDSEEVVRLTATGMKADYFYPANDWAAFDKADADLGSNNPILITVAGATPSKLIATISKGGNGYLLDASSLHGSTTMGGGEKATFSLATSSSVYGSPASYKTAMGTYIVMNSSKATGCPGVTGTSAQVMAVRITPSPLGASVVWCAPNASATNPIATSSDGTSDAIVWYMNNGKLTGVDGDTGATVYTSSNTCSNVPKWSAPIAVKGRIIAAGNGHLCAWGIPGTLSQATPAQPAKAKRHKRTIASVSPHGVL